MDPKEREESEPQSLRQQKRAGASKRRLKEKWAQQKEQTERKEEHT
jgi:hypothetical protein